MAMAPEKLKKIKYQNKKFCIKRKQASLGWHFPLTEQNIVLRTGL
jgi:hypothetical protein